MRHWLDNKKVYLFYFIETTNGCGHRVGKGWPVNEGNIFIKWAVLTFNLTIIGYFGARMINLKNLRLTLVSWRSKNLLFDRRSKEKSSFQYIHKIETKLTWNIFDDESHAFVHSFKMISFKRNESKIKRKRIKPENSNI